LRLHGRERDVTGVMGDAAAAGGIQENGKNVPGAPAPPGRSRKAATARPASLRPPVTAPGACDRGSAGLSALPDCSGDGPRCRRGASLCNP
jgi:hypothetical protein